MTENATWMEHPTSRVRGEALGLAPDSEPACPGCAEFIYCGGVAFGNRHACGRTDAAVELLVLEHVHGRSCTRGTDSGGATCNRREGHEGAHFYRSLYYHLRVFGNDKALAYLNDHLGPKGATEFLVMLTKWEAEEEAERRAYEARCL